MPYTPLDVYLKEVKYSDKSQREYAPIRISEEDFHSPRFSLPHNVELFFRSLIELVLSDIVIQTTRRHTNSYVNSNAERFSSASDSYIFSIIYYMGVISFPYKLDYCNTICIWPNHKSCYHLYFSRFKVIW